MTKRTFFTILVALLGTSDLIRPVTARAEATQFKATEAAAPALDLLDWPLPLLGPAKR